MRTLTIFVLGLTIVLGACQPEQSSGDEGDERVQTDKVELPRSYLFSPEAIEVSRGTTVTWTNHDQFTHTVRLLDGGVEFDEKMEPGEQVELEFDEPGLFRYDCSLHPQDMTGSVLVTG